MGDDMAQINLGDCTSVLVTTDMLLDGVHFDLKSATFKEVGYKAMAVSLSDCAAMATIPIAAVVGVALPASVGREHLEQLHSGISAAAEEFACALVGGDITKWDGTGPFAVSVAMLSRPAGSGPVKRSGAKVGDNICVTGSLGGAVRKKHLAFEPRVREAIRITQMVTVNSMIDISDGLSSDLNRVCRSSGVGAIVDAGRIPISNQAQKDESPLNAALNEGEDFELLFTLSEKDCASLLRKWGGPVAITQIGSVTDTGKTEIEMVDGRIQDLLPGGYDHFRGR
jgi:thiamine-monophosphate kinase